MQFDLNTYSRKHIIAALKKLGFDYVYEVARGAEISTIQTNKYLHEHPEKRPLISTACPAVLRLIQLRYPNLIPNLMPIKSPMEIAAQNARREFCDINNVAPEDVGVFFISPCAAKMTSVKAPLEVHKSSVNGVIPIKTVYFKILKLLSKMKQQDVDDIMLQAGKYGVRWASTGGEALSIDSKRVLYVDGIQNVVKVLEDLEDDKIKNIEFIEASACTGGCTGGPLTVENMYVAKNRSRQQLEDEPTEYKEIENWELEDTAWEKTIEHYEISKLDPDMFKAMEKINKMIEHILSHIHLACSTGAQVDSTAIGKIQNGFLGRGLGKPFFGHKEWFPQKISHYFFSPRMPSSERVRLRPTSRPALVVADLVKEVSSCSPKVISLCFLATFLVFSFFSTTCASCTGA